jgi:2-dehydro-3-deoxyphosphogluconate aldolase/(4S)-4-hydroxy-2-oxoglutarate aldolase
MTVKTGAGSEFVRIRELGVIPVVEITAVDDARPLLEALGAAQLPVAEITLRTKPALEALALMCATYPDFLIGGGTVRTLADARQVVEAGARFVVSPVTNPDVIGFCRAKDVPVIPGACTPTEVDTAVRAGAGAVKIFPAEAIGGRPYIKALAGPFPDVLFVPTGGIGPSNLAEYLRLRQVIACGGSWLVTPQLLGTGKFDRVTALAREAREIVKAVRGGE